jgi:hypothetical protein
MILPPLAAHRVYFRLDFFIADRRLCRASAVGLGQNRIEPLGQQAVQKRLTLLRRELAGQFPQLLD